MRFVCNFYFEDNKLQLYDSTQDKEFYVNVAVSIAHAAFVIYTFCSRGAMLQKHNLSG